MATYAAFKHVELHKIGHGKNRVPNAPRGCISEIFSENGVSKPAANGASNGSSNGAPRSPREAAARPRDTHSRLFGQAARAAAAPPLLTDTLRSNIRFGDDASALGSRSPSGATTPTRASFTPPRRNPVTGDGCNLPPVRRRQSCRTREGNPITGDGYKSINGEINTAVTALNGNAMPINHNRIPPGGYSSGLW